MSEAHVQVQAPGLLYEGSPAASTGAPSRLWRVLLFPVKFFWGMIFCQGLVGSIFVVGWTYRVAQRAVLKHWWSQRARREAYSSFGQFAAAAEVTEGHRHWPNWFTEQNLRQIVRRQPNTGMWTYAKTLARALVYSLWQNFWLGLRAILNTWVLTLPACLLWWFGWYDGWNNSFNKGYEQAAVGPLISILGILLFIASMFYMPLAQARQASTGDWLTFFQFRLVWNIVRLRWLASLGLGLLYAALALPLNILKTSPMFQPQGHPGLATLADAQLIKYLNGYFFWCALLVFPAYVLLRVVAARIYASGMLALVQAGRIDSSQLAPIESEVLEKLGLLAALPSRTRHRFVRFIAWTGTRIGRMVTAVALFFIWFAFVAQIYISEFLQYHRGMGWLNQPLVQLPWFHYLPQRLKSPWQEFSSAVLLWLIALLIASVIKTFRKPRP